MTPFELIAFKQKIGQDYADEVALFVLCHFDSARRGLLGNIGYNFVSRHLVQAQYIFARLKAPAQLEIVKKAGNAWIKAASRPTEKLDLTTSEYNAMRAGLREYFRALPKIEVGTYRNACNVADQAMK